MDNKIGVCDSYFLWVSVTKGICCCVNKVLPSVGVMSRHGNDRLKYRFSRKDNIDVGYLSQIGF
jgi:hypothetical protein